MNDEEELVSECLARPTEEALRMILADYLADHGAEQFEVLLMRSPGEWRIDIIGKNKVFWLVNADDLPVSKSRVTTSGGGHEVDYKVEFTASRMPMCHRHPAVNGWKQVKDGKWECRSCESGHYGVGADPSMRPMMATMAPVPDTYESLVALVRGARASGARLPGIRNVNWPGHEVVLEADSIPGETLQIGSPVFIDDQGRATGYADGRQAFGSVISTNDEARTVTVGQYLPRMVLIGIVRSESRIEIGAHVQYVPGGGIYDGSDTPQRALRAVALQAGDKGASIRIQLL